MMVGRLLLSAALAAMPSGAPPAGVTVSAAVSLTEVLREAAAVYEGRGGARVTLNTGASNVLARQIASGARVDLFISADPAQMDGVRDHVDPASRVVLLANQLAIVVPADRLRRFASARDLADPAIRRIALGDPASVPAGVYGRRYLQTLGVWDRVAPKVVPSGSVRLALAAVENGSADAAIVYRTDVATARHARAAFVVPAAEGPPITYPAAVTRDALNPAGARRFLAFLQSAEAWPIFERAGFRRP